MSSKYEKSRPTSRERSSLLKIGAIAGLAAIAVNTAINNNEALGRIVEAYNGMSSLETTVSDLVSDFVEDTVRVNCGINTAARDAYGPNYSLEGYVEPLHFLGFVYLPSVMSLTKENCENIATINQTSTVNPYTAGSLMIATHEYQHITENDFDEARVACRAIAEFAPRLIRAGLSEASAINTTQTIAAQYYRSQPAVYKNPALCQPGGSYTVDLEQSGLSPIVYFNQNYLG